MTFTYTGDPGSSTLEELRFLIQDTIEEEVLLSDEEIEWLLNKYMPEADSTFYVGAIACEVLAAKFAREVSYSADGISVQAQQLQDKYKMLAEDLRDQYKSQRVGGAPDAGGIFWGDVFDPSIAPLMFSIGMHDNYEAGQQAYGGTMPQPEPEVH